MTANIAFALSAAVLSLAIVIGAALKGDWAVVVVYTLLVLGFLARAAFGRRTRRSDAGEAQAGEAERVPLRGPEHEPERELKRARFRRR